MTFENYTTRSFYILPLFLASAVSVSPVAADVVHNDNVIVVGSLCAGIGCTEFENLGDEALRLKRNSVRLGFVDNSEGETFPKNDWRIVINDTVSGGQEFFGIEDSTSGDMPVRIDAGAPSHAMYVAENGDVGFGTNLPEVELHVLSGLTPSVRLEQDGSSGFAPQTWELAGNEASFFIADRSATIGTTLPLVIDPNSPTNSIKIERSSGDVGLMPGTVSWARVDAALYLMRDDSSAKLLIEDTGTNFNTQIELIKAGTPRIRFDDSRYDVAAPDGNQLSAEWDLGMDNNRDFILRNVETNFNVYKVLKTGDLVLEGALTENSDKNAKMAIVPVDQQEILSKVQSLPIATWSYKDSAGIRHIGPMAQDFYALFGTGHGETGISTLDTSGVALAAIKALSDENALLKARLDALELQITQ